MLDKMKKIFELQGKISQIKKELQATTVEATRSDGGIKIVMNGEQRVLSLDISDALIVAQDKERLKKDLQDCINEAIKKAQELATQKAKEITGLDIPGI
ncbi:MAG: YbaB/EbfC family nucleoid-associated protein [Candidatus Omnitrophota bacterium]|nr:YbaB/EbfC family nucleoid-associated protein [Candidatus Omnitrophota bacterium]